MAPPSIQLLLTDVDGTLVTQDKVLTKRAIAAVERLRQAGILFAVTSGRPPRGMSMLIEPLELSTPIAAFNGGLFARPDMSVIEQQVIPDEVTPAVIELLAAHEMSVWVYRGADEPQVIEWLHIAASVPGFDGFAVGRTLWEQPLRDMIAGTVGRGEAVDRIAARYVETVRGFAA